MRLASSASVYMRAYMVWGISIALGLCIGILSLSAQRAPSGTDQFLDHQRDDQGIIRVYATNHAPVPAYFRITAQTVANYIPSDPLPAIKVVAAAQYDIEVLVFTPANPQQSSQLRYAYTAALGNPFEAHHDDNFRYLFPYQHGEKFEVSQTHFGRYSHNDDMNRYAVDFNMPTGTAVHAARSGIVAEIKQDSNIGGTGDRYAHFANYILIAHDDGSFAQYVHLQQNGARVQIGEQVLAGDHIGLSGNTGNSSGPHLHFDVRIPSTDGYLLSIPVIFHGVDGDVEVPQEYSYHYAVHPGKPAFTVELGSQLVPENFAGYIRAVAETNRFDIRDERIDGAIVLYVSNGYADDRQVEITVESVGVRAALDYPLRITIPAQSELFCGLFYRIAGAPNVRIVPNIRAYYP